MAIQLRTQDIGYYAEEEIEIILSKDHGGLYCADTDEVQFSLDNVTGISTAKLYCYNHTTNERELVKEYSHKLNKQNYNEGIDQVILLHKLFNIEVPEMYLNVFEG